MAVSELKNITKGWVENEDPLKITYKYLEMGISTLDV